VKNLPEAAAHRQALQMPDREAGQTQRWSGAVGAVPGGIFARQRVQFHGRVPDDGQQVPKGHAIFYRHFSTVMDVSYSWHLSNHPFRLIIDKTGDPFNL
jgi:hypothetical protein